MARVDHVAQWCREAYFIVIPLSVVVGIVEDRVVVKEGSAKTLRMVAVLGQVLEMPCLPECGQVQGGERRRISGQRHLY